MVFLQVEASLTLSKLSLLMAFIDAVDHYKWKRDIREWSGEEGKKVGSNEGMENNIRILF